MDIEEFRNDIKIIFDLSIKKVFDNKTLIYLKKLNKSIIEKRLFNKQQIYNLILRQLSTYDNLKTSILLYNLNVFKDFNLELKSRYPYLEKLLTAYRYFVIKNFDENNDNSFKGLCRSSSILGYLIKNNNDRLVIDFIKELENTKLIPNSIVCIGAGSTSIVYKIGNYVLKIGIDRNSRKIFVNHRILASQFRKFIKTDDKSGFYVEIMKYLKDTNVTKEECLELQEDLLRQGLIWDDPKLENCGLLNDGDENISYLDVDYEEVEGIIDNPLDRENFMKRKRKVVVLDNDNIRRDFRSMWK